MMIRGARPEERQALEDLQRRASLMWEDYRSWLLANPDAIELPLAQLEGGHVRVADSGGHAAGFAVVMPRSEMHFLLEGLFVEPAHWHGGIGRALVADAVARLPAGGLLEVLANPRAEGFYRKIGFTAFGSAPTQFGPANRMGLEIPPKSRET
jgi:GNAT superfamily N-acetyltransferase